MKRIDWNWPITVAVVGAGAAVIAAVLAPLVSHWLTQPAPRTLPPSVEKHVIDELEKISKKAEYQISTSPTVRDQTLEGIYVRANQNLFAHYAELDGKQRKDEKVDLVYLMGPAGAGKSTLLKSFGTKSKCLVDLGKAFAASGALSKYSVPKSDLKVGDRVFNELPGLRDQTRFTFSDILQETGCCSSKACKELVILDALDELHPELSKFLLEIIDNALRSKTEAPLPPRILIVGRPEGFHYYLKDRSRTPDVKPTTIQFELPKYVSKGELNVLFRDLYGNQKRVVSETEQDKFTSLITSNSWLTYTVSYLAYARFLNEYVPLANQEGNPKKALFDNILESNYESHRRPQIDNAVYVGLLEEIAAKYSEYAAANDGFFVVNFEDVVSVYPDDQATAKLGTLPVREILNRSGIAFLDPADVRRIQYRFQPQWIHGHLIERWNSRIRKQ